MWFMKRREKLQPISAVHKYLCSSALDVGFYNSALYKATY